MTRVSEVLDYLTEPELLKWFRNNSKAKVEAIGKEALRVGNIVDQLVQDDIRNNGYLLVGEEPQIRSCMMAWELFKKEHPKFVGSIRSMQDELIRGDIVGHPDFIMEDGIIDLKTSKSIQPRHWTQTAKYLHLKWGEDIKNKFIGVLRLDKESGLYEFKMINVEDYIRYEISVFEAYWVAYQHNVKNREQIRGQLEEELLAIS